jgi:hypothetical protein
MLAGATLTVAALLWSVYNAHPLSLVLATFMYVIAVAAPGRILLKRILPGITNLHAWVFGSIAVEILLGIMLKFTGSSLIVGAILPLASAGIFVKSKRKSPPDSATPYAHIGAICFTVLAFLGLFLYGQAFDQGASYHFSYNPTVDLTYFQTVLTSISNFGEFKDLAHLGYHFNYPDLGYQVLSFVHRASGAEAFDIIFFFAPFKDFLLLSLGIYALLVARVNGWIAVIASVSFYIFSSRSLLDLNVPITNPAYREGLCILLLTLWAYDRNELTRKWIVITLAFIGLVLVKPAIFLVAAPALFLAELVAAVRSKRFNDLGYLAIILASCWAVFFILFAPGKSGLSGGHYSVVFGEGLRNTIEALGKISGSILDWKEIVIRPLSTITLGSILLGLLLFLPFLLQQMQHAGRLVALAVSYGTKKHLGRLELQLIAVVVICFAVLAFVGMEYSSFVHVYLLPLALTASTILLALSFERLRSSRFGIAWMVILILGLLYDVGFAGYGYYTERTQKASVSVPSALIEEFRKVRDITCTSSIIATYQTGLFQPGDERSYLAAAFTERKLLGEGAIYGSLIMGYQENLKAQTSSPVSDTLRDRRSSRDSIFYSTDTVSARQSARRYGVTHVLIRHGQGERILSQVGDTIFHGRMLTLLKL